MRTEKRVEKELNEALERYKIWNEKIDNKEILWRNTEEEINELDKDIKREIILPLIAELKWIRLNKS